MENLEMGGIVHPDGFWIPLIYAWNLVVLATQSSDINDMKKSRPEDSVFLFCVDLGKGLQMTIIPQVTSPLMTPYHYKAI